MLEPAGPFRFNNSLVSTLWQLLQHVALDSTHIRRITQALVFSSCYVWIVDSLPPCGGAKWGSGAGRRRGGAGVEQRRRGNEDRMRRMLVGQWERGWEGQRGEGGTILRAGDKLKTEKWRGALPPSPSLSLSRPFYLLPRMYSCEAQRKDGGWLKWSDWSVVVVFIREA